MNITYTNTITAEDYNLLRASAGWRIISKDQAEASIQGSAFLVAAVDGEKSVGTARLVWDGGYAALIKDVLVLPEYQRMGIGTEMVTQLLDFLKSQMKPGWGMSIDLTAATGKEGFYQRFGFVSLPHERRGAGMELWIEKP